MTIRTAFIGAGVLVLSALSASAQGRQPQQVVLSQAVMKSMVANKPKSKTPPTARPGMVRRANIVATKQGHAAPTSVHQISHSNSKNQ